MLKAGDVTTIFANQGERDCSLLEVHEHYSLGVYVMPAGGSFLTRILPEGRLSRPTKAERQKYQKEILQAALEWSYEREDEADTMRSGWKKQLKIKEILADRARIESKLKVYDEPTPTSTPCP
jgi:hypothetical protein